MIIITHLVIIDDDEQTRGRIALQGDLRIVCVELASHQFHRGCAIGTAIPQHRTEEQNYDYEIWL